MNKLRKKIIFISLSLAKGGAENQLVNLSIFLKRVGFDVKIINVLPHNDFQQELSRAEISNHYFNYRSFNGLSSLVLFIWREKPVILITFMFGANIIGRILKLIFRVPLITSVRHNDISRFYSVIYSISYGIDNKTIFNSQDALDKFLKMKIANKKKSFLINNAIKVDKSLLFQKSSREDRLVSIAHFRKEKDYETLFVAISILKNENTKVIVDILGNDFNLEWPKERVKELDIEDLINFHGFVNNPKEYIVTADAVILSSLGEGTPNALLEGMANKKPVIASRIPGCETLVTLGKCGFLFEKQNPRDLADKIMEFIKLDESQKNDLGQNGFEFIERNFEYVGKDFSKKVREIYYDKKNNKTIYGITSPEERKELKEEGIDLLSIPWLDKDN